MKFKNIKPIVQKALSVLNRLDALLPPEEREPDWAASIAFRWQKAGNRGILHSLPRPHTFPLNRLAAIDTQHRATPGRPRRQQCFADWRARYGQIVAGQSTVARIRRTRPAPD